MSYVHKAWHLGRSNKLHHIHNASHIIKKNHLYFEEWIIIKRLLSRCFQCVYVKQPFTIAPAHYNPLNATADSVCDNGLVLGIMSLLALTPVGVSSPGNCFLCLINSSPSRSRIITSWDMFVIFTLGQWVLHLLSISKYTICLLSLHWVIISECVKIKKTKLSKSYLAVGAK